MTETTKAKDFRVEAKKSKLFLNLLVSKWTVSVIYELCHDTKRYSEIHKAIDGVTQKALTDTLRKMERNGLIERIIYPVIPPKVEYKLTALGLELHKMTGAMADWLETHVEELDRAQNAYDSVEK